jgi:hypothetical protein
MPGRRKGQFFILGALLLCTAFFLALPAQVTLTGTQTRDIERLADNLESEIPRALNIAMLEDGSPDNLGDFTQFLRQSTRDRYLTLESLWAVTIPDPETGDVEVYAGNWLGRPVTLSLTMDGSTENLAINDGETGSEVFYGAGSDFTLEVCFEGRAWSARVARDKVNLYNYLSLSRGENSIVREITG